MPRIDRNLYLEITDLQNIILVSPVRIYSVHVQMRHETVHYFNGAEMTLPSRSGRFNAVFIDPSERLAELATYLDSDGFGPAHMARPVHVNISQGRPELANNYTVYKRCFPVRYDLSTFFEDDVNELIRIETVWHYHDCETHLNPPPDIAEEQIERHEMFATMFDNYFNEVVHNPLDRKKSKIPLVNWRQFGF